MSDRISEALYKCLITITIYNYSLLVLSTSFQLSYGSDATLRVSLSNVELLI